MNKLERSVVLNIACSLDGYIATKDESLEWLFKVDGQEEANKGIEKFEETIDTVIMGRKTFDWVMKELNGENPYADKTTFVYSHHPHEDTEKVHYTQKDPVELIEILREQNGGNIWLMGGGFVIRDFLEAGLVDEIVITVAPVLLGEGIRLFKEGNYSSEWTLKRTRQVGQFAELNLERK